ncbi:MAG: DNA repair protein RecO [Candidatus Pacebacteria bacterium]|nr:DNA repair protein RecO [Candidatus Paceibacterota bacterium]
MSYHIYRTEGFVLSGTDAGESNRFYHIYTEEFGLIGVWGQGVRKLESKLRFNLQDFSHVRVHLVCGKNMWKLTDVDRIGSFQKLLASEEKRLLVGRLVSLMKRLLEEGSDPVLYDFFVTALEYLEKQMMNKEQLRSFEVLFVLRVLHHLGYGEEAVPTDLSRSHVWNDDVFASVWKQHKKLVKIASTSLQQTHM